MQSDRDADRIRQLGLAADRVLMSGNLKFDSAEVTAESAVAIALRNRFELDESVPLVVAGSTHAPEEVVVVEAFKQTREQQPSARLLIAPRHPERFSEVATLLNKSGLKWARRSEERKPEDAGCDVILLDTVGELRAAYAMATVAFVGGSIAPAGGHNVLEPASLGIAVITGSHTENFAAITKVLLAENAIVQLSPSEPSQAAAELASVLAELLKDETRRGEIGRRALTVCRQNRGATERTMQVIEEILAAPATAGSQPALTTVPLTAAK
jgi:3-deoxy-D-manno-octulosonic-acid transferase